MDDHIDFEKMFENLIKKHKDDKNYDLIKDYPVIFSLMTDIASDRHSDGPVKMIMNSAISYFVITVDAISEKEFGIRGYLDDFFLCLHALNELLKNEPKLGGYLISKHWRLEEDYQDYIPGKYYKLMGMIDPKLIADIQSFSGMNYVEELISSKKNPRTYSEKKIRSLERKLQYMFFLLFKQPLVGNEAKKEFEQQFLETKEFVEFTRKIDLLSESDDEFKSLKNNVDEILTGEERLKKVRLKRILHEWTKGPV